MSTEKYIHEIKLSGNDEFSKRFNYVSWLWQRYSETDDDKYLDEHFNAKLALEQGHPMSFINEYEPINTGASAEGLFTKEQQDYVNSVSDEGLRGHLLHQVRLRDIASADRDAFEKQCSKNYNQAIEEALQQVEKYNTGKELTPIVTAIINSIKQLKK